MTRQKKLRVQNKSIFAEAQVKNSNGVQVEDTQQDDAEAEAHISEIINSSDNDDEPALPIATDIWQKADFWTNKPPTKQPQPKTEEKINKKPIEEEKQKSAEPIEDSDYMKAWKALPAAVLRSARAARRGGSPKRALAPLTR